MVVPALEVVFTNIGNATIDDESTGDGKTGLNAFVSGAQNIPGVNFAAWVMKYKYPDIAMQFIGKAWSAARSLGLSWSLGEWSWIQADYDTRRQHEAHKDKIGGPVPDALKRIVNVEKANLYLIHPQTSGRQIFYAPQNNVVLFYGIDKDKFSELSPEFFTAIAKSDSCIDYIWGQIEAAALSDKSEILRLGKCGIMISGWGSREEHDRDVAKPRVTEAYKAISTAVRKTDSWGVQVSLVENNGHLRKRRREVVVDASKTLVAPGKY